MPLFLCLVRACGNKDLHPWHPFGVSQFIHIVSVLKTQIFYEEQANEMAFIAPHIGLAWDFFPVQATLSYASLPLPPPPHFPPPFLTTPHFLLFFFSPPPPPHIIPSNLSLLSSASDNLLLSPYPPPPPPFPARALGVSTRVTPNLVIVLWTSIKAVCLLNLILVMKCRLWHWSKGVDVSFEQVCYKVDSIFQLRSG